MNEDRQLGPFTARGGAVVAARPDARSTCPVSEHEVRWAASDVFNPGGVVRDGKMHLLLRAEDAVGRCGGTSRIGLAARGQVGNLCFAQTLVLFNGACRLYYRMADSRIGCAVAPWSAAERTPASALGSPYPGTPGPRTWAWETFIRSSR